MAVVTASTAAMAPSVLASDASLAAERRELVCCYLSLAVKLGLTLVAAVSLVRLAGAYQERMDRQGELRAVLDLQSSRLQRAREDFDRLFVVGGEQALLRQQDQWIAPNRLRIVWQRAGSSSSTRISPELTP